jgi:hypothetical protein
VIKHIRPDLCRAYSDILDSPPAIRQIVATEDRPKSPPRLVVAHGTTELADPTRRYMADTSYWLTFRSLEFPQILNPASRSEHCTSYRNFTEDWKRW